MTVRARLPTNRFVLSSPMGIGLARNHVLRHPDDRHENGRLLRRQNHRTDGMGITTFGGHPVCCAAGLAALEYILEETVARYGKQTFEFYARGSAFQNDGGSQTGSSTTTVRYNDTAGRIYFKAIDRADRPLKRAAGKKSDESDEGRRSRKRNTAELSTILIGIPEQDIRIFRISHRLTIPSLRPRRSCRRPISEKRQAPGNDCRPHRRNPDRATDRLRSGKQPFLPARFLAFRNI